MPVRLPRDIAPSRWESRGLLIAGGSAATPLRWIVPTVAAGLVVVFVAVSVGRGFSPSAVPAWLGGMAQPFDDGPPAGAAPLDPTQPRDDQPSDTSAQLPAGYTFLTTIGTSPVLADACAPVAYLFDPAGAPPGRADAVAAAVADAAELTGLVIAPEEPTTRPGLVITVSFRAEADDDGLSGPAIGVTRSQTGGPLDAPHLSEAEIALETEWFTAAVTREPDVATMVVLHELGHALGLAHTDDSTSIMYPAAGADHVSEQDERAFGLLNRGC